MMKNPITLTLSILLLLSNSLLAETVVTPPLIRGREPSLKNELRPSDTLSRLLLLKQELDQIRLEMGKPQNIQAPIVIENASPREVYFQAFSLYEKINRFAFERTLSITPDEIRIDNEDINIGEVWALIDKALGRTLFVKDFLKITEPIIEPLSTSETNATDIYVECINVQRQIDILLTESYSPNDVYRQVNYAINYAARLLSAFPGQRRIPHDPEFERRKRPDHVYISLLNAFGKITEIYKLSDHRILTLKEDAQSIKNKKPGDVYNLASLIISELAHIHSSHGALGEPTPSYEPNNKFPSHVYQKTLVLNLQLDLLLELVKNNPNWLK